MNNVGAERMLWYDADDDDEEEEIHFVALGFAGDFPRNRRIVLERRNVLVPPADDEASVPKLPTTFALPDA